MELDDPYENLGAQLAKEVATKTNDIAGDGTTTATALAQALVHEGPQGRRFRLQPGRPEARHRRSRGRRRGPSAGKLLEIQTTQDMANIATISARDEQIGTLIAEAFDKVGKDGVITVDESQTFGTELEFTEGMQFDKGYLSPYFVTDPDRMEAVLEDPYILINSGKISSMTDLLPPAGEGHRCFRHAVPGGRGFGRGGAFHPRGQQDPRHLQSRSRRPRW